MASAGLSMESGGPEQRTGVVEYALPVLEEIRSLAIGGARAGLTGVEIGGVLFGRREGHRIRILAQRPLEGESLRGPSFGSELELKALEELLLKAPAMRKLRDLEPVGWYRSNLEQDLTLTERDLRLFDRFFPQPWQMAVLLKPSETAVARVRFFFRPAESQAGGPISYREFTLSAGGEASLAETVAPEAPEASVAASAPSGSALVARWTLLLAVLGGLAAAIYWALLPPVRLALQARDASGQLRITWNGASRLARQARGAHLEIADGSAKVWMELNPAQLHEGNLTYARRSNSVEVRLKVEGPDRGVAEEVARFLGPPEPLAPPPVQAPPQPGAAAQPAPPAPAPAPKAPLAEASTRPHAAAVSKPAVAAVAAPPPSRPAVAPAAASAGPAPPAAVSAPPAPAPKAQAPDLTPPPVVAQELRPQNPSRPETIAPPPPAPAPEPEKPPARPAVTAAPSSPPARPTPAAPVVGRLIWTGQLPKNGTLTIEARKPSAGALTGQLPGKPVRIAVYPGDLSADGIVVFTPHSQYARPLAESPDAQNGWNKTTYTWNAQRSSEVVVAEGPGAQNGWSRIVLRSRTGKFSVIVVDWTVLQ